MSLSRVCLFAAVLFLLFMVGGCESNSASRTSTGRKSVGMPENRSEIQSVKEALGLDEGYEVRATDIELRSDGSVLIPRFDLDLAILVVDTSGSMRERGTNLMRQDVLGRIGAFLVSMPDGARVKVLDGSGHKIVLSSDEGLAASEEGGRTLLAGSIVRDIAAYPYESESNWLSGLRAALKVAREEDVDERVEVFVFGDEYTGNSIKELESLLSAGDRFPVNVVRAHEGLIESQFFVSPTKFELTGSRAAVLTGGRYFRFVPSVFSQTPEAMLLGRLAIEHQGETWYLDEDEESVEKWNALLRDDFQTDRRFLVALSEEAAEADANGIFVAIREEEGAGGNDRYYVEYRATGGGKAYEYRAVLRWVKGGYAIADWELLWETD